MLIPENRLSTLPGGFFKYEFLEPWGMMVEAFANQAGWPSAYLIKIIEGKLAITRETALVLQNATGMSADFWFNAQQALDTVKKEKE